MADEPPGYTITAESESIVVPHTGKLTMQALESSRREAAKLATATHLAGFLFDVSRAFPSLHTVDMFDLCVSYGSVLPPHPAIAVVFRPDQFTVDDVLFGERVRSNRGIVLRTFIECETAQQWLSAQRGPRVD